MNLAAAANNPQNAQLTDRARLTLITMCLYAVDPESKTKNGTPPGEYWGGHEILITHLFGDIQDKGSAEYRTAQRLTRRYVAELITAGLVTRTTPAGRSRPPRYTLRPLGPTGPDTCG